MSSKGKDTMVEIMENWLAANDTTFEAIKRDALPDNIKEIYDALTG